MGSVLSALVLLVTVGTLERAVPAAPAQWSYLYHASDVTGAIATSWAPITYDERANELFVVNQSEGLVRVFNAAGMETFRFGGDRELGVVTSLAVLSDGDLVVIATASGSSRVVRLNFRGDPEGPFVLRGVPDGLGESFQPSAVVARAGMVYLADLSSMKVVVADEEGSFQRAVDLAQLMGLPAQERENNQINGFDVDSAGNILFTIPTFFSAYVATPAGELKSFGSRGSRPGRFNIIGGITADEQGNLYVSDLLRCVVMVFDKEYRLLGELGGRGRAPEGLVGPMGLAAAGGRVFVSQGASRGVAVFRLSLAFGPETSRRPATDLETAEAAVTGPAAPARSGTLLSKEKST